MKNELKHDAFPVVETRRWDITGMCDTRGFTIHGHKILYAFLNADGFCILIGLHKSS